MKRTLFIGWKCESLIESGASLGAHLNSRDFKTWEVDDFVGQSRVRHKTNGVIIEESIVDPEDCEVCISTFVNANFHLINKIRGHYDLVEITLLCTVYSGVSDGFVFGGDVISKLAGVRSELSVEIYLIDAE